ncbi:methyl-accepting chemotaxis protein [Saccharibacillus sp. CPCC 101409]|uniref:methyl-accepting chemotaxis protein n=1 Tax=Saccharibacillus sp. CPCC 101409 TaxID=3058041 RepID=UPI00267172A1|nr:methyl-accepting chemotaxis protein [Saccharibacillus sp. CPCC 101409]MDO3408169.1 methyl-accepting chemotaxis protein [Saccharibacillus sp. CPCC 101409]
MKRLRMSIAAKIGLGYLVIVLGLVVAVFGVLSQIDKLETEMNFIAGHDMDVHDRAGRIEQNVVNMETGQRGFVITGEDSYLEPYNTGKQDWVENYDALHRLVSDNPAQQAKLEEIRAKIEDWIQVAGEATILMKRAGNAEGLNQFFAEDPGKQDMDAFREMMNTFVSTEKALTEKRVAALHASNQSLKFALYVLLGGVVIAAALLAWFTSTRISRSVKSVARTIREMASSGGDLTQRIQVRSNDEVRDLGDSTNLLLGSLQEMIGHIKADTLRLTDASVSLEQGARENSRAVKEVTTSIQRVAEGSERQVTQTEDISAVMQQTIAGLEQVAGAAADVAELAKETRGMAADGESRIKQSVEQVQGVADTFHTIRGSVSELAERSNEVLSITGYISETSSQTNLLALNAAIEAARAGEHGLGFSVVASEIRKLADQSSRSTQEISRIITAMTTGIRDIVELVESSSGGVEHGVASLGDAGAAFDAIVDRIGALSAQIGEVAATVEQMSAGSQSVGTSVMEITRVTEEMAALTQEVSAMSQEQSASMTEMEGTSVRLKEMANSLSDIVDKFKI